MSLTVFLAICILGCDVLIYFLYEWALGESKPIREHRATSRWQPEWSAAESKRPAEKRIIEMPRNPKRPAASAPRPQALEEKWAYQRLAASFAAGKPRA